jgi:hypothetical protein
MSRLPVCRKPLVILDACAAHGQWCDGGELGQLKAVARSRGVAEALGGGFARPAPAAGRRRIGGTSAGDGADPLLEELRRRPGGGGLVPAAVAWNDARAGGGSGFRWGRRRGGGDFLHVLFDILLG